MENWIDITHPITSDMVVWEGDDRVILSKSADIKSGDVYNLTRLNCSVHTGTHMDAPLHFIEDGKDISQAPLSVLMGSMRIIELCEVDQIEAIHLKDVESKHGLFKEGEKLLFKTRNSQWDWLCEPFRTDFCALSPCAATFLMERKVGLVGIDYLSIAPYPDEELIKTHQILLGAEIWVIEGLDLRRVGEGYYEMCCLPLKITGADGSPARVVVKAV